MGSIYTNSYIAKKRFSGAFKFSDRNKGLLFMFQYANRDFCSFVIYFKIKNEVEQMLAQSKKLPFLI